MQSNAVSEQKNIEPLKYKHFLTRKIIIPFIFIAAIVAFLQIDVYRSNLPAKVFHENYDTASAVVTKAEYIRSGEDDSWSEELIIEFEYSYNGIEYNPSVSGYYFAEYTNNDFPEVNYTFPIFVKKDSPDNYLFESQEVKPNPQVGYFKFLVIVAIILGIRIVIEIIDIIERWQNNRLVPYEDKKNIDEFDNDRGLFAVSKYEPPKDNRNKGGSEDDTFSVHTTSNVNQNDDLDDMEVPDYLRNYSTKQFPVKPVKKGRSANILWIIILIVLHVLCLYRFTNDFIKQYNYDQTAADISRVESHVIESEEDSSTTTYTVTFSYTYNGQVYSGAYNADAEPHNRSISVLVNPDNPNDYWVVQSRPEVLIILFIDTVIAAAIVLNKLNKKK